MRQFAVGGSAKDRIEVTQQHTPPAFHGGCGERGNVARKPKGAIEPEFEARTDKVDAVLFDEARLAVEMGKAGLVVQPIPLLACGPEKQPDCAMSESRWTGFRLRRGSERLFETALGKVLP